MFQIVEPTEQERNHPDFVQGWNACLGMDDGRVFGSPAAFHAGWMSAAKAIAEDNGSVLNILPRVWTAEPGVVISTRRTTKQPQKGWEL